MDAVERHVVEIAQLEWGAERQLIVGEEQDGRDQGAKSEDGQRPGTVPPPEDLREEINPQDRRYRRHLEFDDRSPRREETGRRKPNTLPSWRLLPDQPE